MNSATSATRETAAFEYRPDIDGLRAIAILAVVAFHASSDTLPGGFCGVDVFFVISGFLITGIIVQQLNAGRFSLRQFYFRRARRLFPALAVVLFATFALGWLILLPAEFQRLGKDAVAGAAFSSNLFYYADVVPYFYTENRPLMHLWSLGVEEQFYFLWPTLLYLAWKLNGRWIRLVPLFVIVASFSANIAVVSLDTHAAFYLPWNRLWELALGAALVRSRQTRAEDPPVSKTATSIWRGNLCAAGGLILLALSFWYLRSEMEFPGAYALGPSLGAALMIAAGPATWVSRFVLSRRPVVFVGLISYPLYLWHWPLLCFTRLVQPAPDSPLLALAAALLVALALSVLTYKYVELPVRHSRGQPFVLASVCASLVCCAALGYMVAVQTIASRPVSAEVERALPANEDWLKADRTSWTDLPDDLIEVGSGPTRTLFIGDSFMAQYYPRIERVVEESPGRVSSAAFAIRGACSLPYEFSAAYGEEGCRRHIEKAFAYAERRDVDTVVVASAWPLYFMTRSPRGLVLNPKSAPALARFKDTVARWRAANKRVFIVLVGPIDGRLDPNGRIQRTVFSPGFRITDAHPPKKEEIQHRVDPIQSLLRQIALDTGAIIIDPMESLCDQTTCPAVAPDGRAIYLDNAHQRRSFVRENATFMDQTVSR